jgi:RTA1 like protein
VQPRCGGKRRFLILSHRLPQTSSLSTSLLVCCFLSPKTPSSIATTASMSDYGTANCTLATCPVTHSIFYYQPSFTANLAFLVLFAATGILHFAQGTYTKKTSFTVAVCIGCFTEVIGYLGRLISWHNPFSLDGFLTQICCLTIAPAFFSAGIYFCLSDIVKYVSVEASRIPPSAYARIFIPCDLISLALQGAGGGLASVAAENNRSARTGTNIMVAGLAFQVASMTLFILLAIGYVLHVKRLDKEAGSARISMPVSQPRLFAFASFFSLAIICIFIRCIYRVIELSEGWEGSLIHNQTDFIVLEGM